MKRLALILTLPLCVFLLSSISPDDDVRARDAEAITAAVKLEALWGIDYVHLGKFEGEWKILQVIWQSRPE